MTNNVLEKIVTHKRRQVELARQARPLEQVEHLASLTPTPRNFFAAVTRPARRVHIIAEAKWASPPSGLLRETYEPAQVAMGYAEHGAAAVCCATDAMSFHGKLEHIDQVKAAVGLPVLQRDFIIDKYQLYESRLHGADAVLLIAALLPPGELVDMLILATQLQLTAVVEVHSVDQLLAVRPYLGFPHAGYCLLAINNRDWSTLRLDPGHTSRLMDMVEEPRKVMSLSGIRSAAALRELKQAGVGAAIVGECLLRQPSPGAALGQLLHAAWPDAA